MAPWTRSAERSRCWASSFGGCEGPLTREHYLSSNVLAGRPVQVTGLPWCRDELKQVSAASFTRNMLCRSHNNRLSPLDTAGGLAFRELVAFGKTFRAAAMVSPNARLRAQKTQSIDGPRFERWLLKTIVNLAFQTFRDGGPEWTPPLEWVEIVYGRKQFADKCGLYVEEVCSELRGDDGDYFAVLMRTNPRTGALVGGQIKINDWRFAVTMTPLSEHNCKHHPGRIELIHDQEVFRVLDFNWP